jgi:hypothetical protein
MEQVQLPDSDDVVGDAAQDRSLIRSHIATDRVGHRKCESRRWPFIETVWRCGNFSERSQRSVELVGTDHCPRCPCHGLENITHLVHVAVIQGDVSRRSVPADQRKRFGDSIRDLSGSPNSPACKVREPYPEGKQHHESIFTQVTWR